jgi:hypothetical protein
MDTLGWLLAIVVTAASVQDRDGARWLLSHLPSGCKKLRKIWVDGGYSGRLVDWVARTFQILSGCGIATQTNEEVRAVAPPLGGRAHLRLAEPLTPPQQKL